MISGFPGPIPLEINNLELWFPSSESPALVDVNLRLMPGTVTAIIGPAGVGKSTLFKAILSELAISNGTIKVAGKEVKNGEAVDPNDFSYVPQKTNLIPKLTVWQTLELAVYSRLPEAKTREARHQVINDVLQKLSMTHKKDGLIKDLSGGEERRVSIALELVSNPHLLLLDEPTSGLDEGLDKELHETLRNLADDARKPAVLFVTHSTTHLDLVDPHTGRLFVDQVVAIGKATNKSNTATVRHIGAPGQILKDFGVSSYSDVMKILRAEPKQLPKISTEEPDSAFKRSYKTLSWSRSYLYNLKRQWLLIGKSMGLLKSIRNTVLMGAVVAAVLWMVSRLGLGVNLDGVNQEFLTYTSMLVLLLAFGGTLLPIMGIVTSWDVMRREQRWGVSARSFIWAQLTLQMLLILPAVAAATLLSLWLTSGPTDQTLLPQTERFSAYWQLFALLLLPTLASYAIGVYIGSSQTSSNKANYLSGLVFAIMLVGNGLIFSWHEFWAIYYPSFLIPSRNGIALIASNFNAEMVMGGTTDDAFRMSINGLYLAMAVLALVGLFFLVLAMFAVKSPLRQTGSAAVETSSSTRKGIGQGKLLPAAIFASALLISFATIYANRTSEGEVFGTPDIAQANPVTAQQSSETGTTSNSQSPQESLYTENGWVGPVPTPIHPQSPMQSAVQSNPVNQPADTYTAAATGDDERTPAVMAEADQPSASLSESPTPENPVVQEADDNPVNVLASQDTQVDSETVALQNESVETTMSSQATASTPAALTASSADTDSDDAVTVAQNNPPEVSLQSTVATPSELETQAPLQSPAQVSEEPLDADPETSEPAESVTTYVDIGGDAEPELREFLDVVNTEAIGESCELGDFQDVTKRSLSTQLEGAFPIVTVDVTEGRQTTLRFCIEEPEADASSWTIWLGLNPPSEFDCDSLHLNKPDNMEPGLNIVEWTIPAECVHQDRMMLVFADLDNDGTAIWGILIEQDEVNATDP